MTMMPPTAGTMATTHRDPRGHHQDLITLAALEVDEADRHKTHLEEEVPHEEGPTMAGRHPEMATHHGRQLEEHKHQPQDLQQTLAQNQHLYHHRQSNMLMNLCAVRGTFHSSRPLIVFSISPRIQKNLHRRPVLKTTVAQREPRPAQAPPRPMRGHTESAEQKAEMVLLNLSSTILTLKFTTPLRAALVYPAEAT